MASEDPIGDQDDANERACIEEAARNNYSIEQANNCDEGNLNCKNCPFKSK